MPNVVYSILTVYKGSASQIQCLFQRWKLQNREKSTDSTDTDQ